MLVFPRVQRRTAAMGSAIAAGSAGFIVGPLIGGYLAELIGMTLLCYVTALIFIGNASLAAVGLPQQPPKQVLAEDPLPASVTASPYDICKLRFYAHRTLVN